MNISMRSNTRGTRRSTTWKSGTQEIVEETPIAQPPMQTPMQMDTMMMDATNNQMVTEDMEAKKMLKPWEKGGIKLKKKKKKEPGAKNLRIRKYVQPKNAVMCLNELQPGLTYVTETGKSVGVPVCVSVEVHGQKYKGFGSSKALAKQAAAEAALISFVKPPAESTDPSTDETPWAALASFAIFKLFNEWREGRVGMLPPAASQAMNLVFPQGTATAGAIAPVLANPAVAPMVESKSNDSTHPKPAKTLPENAATIHPTVVLHQMRPSIQYNIEITTENNAKVFVASAVIDGQHFTGQGLKVKKAKFLLAKNAIKVLFGVDNTFAMPDK